MTEFRERLIEVAERLAIGRCDRTVREELSLEISLDGVCRGMTFLLLLADLGFANSGKSPVPKNRIEGIVLRP